ncbi:hypothetical protein [Arthrobacter sp. ES3-54]|uniref:hypothetical protein n=1 Tax=Arthrobacter sp. ES3-54 TaxID=1502991 RepID=UPI00240752CC|nr:hypothetical protein [Arthrobacter sp. ES3-54]
MVNLFRDPGLQLVVLANSSKLVGEVGVLRDEEQQLFIDVRIIESSLVQELVDSRRDLDITQQNSSCWSLSSALLFSSATDWGSLICPNYSISCFGR